MTEFMRSHSTIRRHPDAAPVKGTSEVETETGAIVRCPSSFRIGSVVQSTMIHLDRKMIVGGVPNKIGRNIEPHTFHHSKQRIAMIVGTHRGEKVRVGIVG